MLLPSDADLVGLYGGHSDLSRAAAQAYDTTGKVYDSSGQLAPPLWICGHFVGKAFAPLLEDLQRDELRGQSMLLWQTKSAVQPRGSEDEWAQLLEMPDDVKDWASEGHAESALRPGKVDTASGRRADYRSIMTPLEPPHV